MYNNEKLFNIHFKVNKQKLLTLNYLVSNPHVIVVIGSFPLIHITNTHRVPFLLLWVLLNKIQTNIYFFLAFKFDIVRYIQCCKENL